MHKTIKALMMNNDDPFDDSEDARFRIHMASLNAEISDEELLDEDPYDDEGARFLGQL